MKTIKTLVFVVAIFIALAPAASAQSFKATVIGTAVDSTGAVVPGATVTIVQEGTGLTVSTTTSVEGTFSLPQLPPGQYELTVELPGFRKFIQRSLVLETDQVRRVEARLELGNIAE